MHYVIKSRECVRNTYSTTEPIHWGCIWGRGCLGELGCLLGGPVQIACSGVERNEFSTRLFATTAKMLLLAQSFFSQLSKHVSVCHHGCYWFLFEKIK